MERYDFDFHSAPEFSSLREKLKGFDNKMGRTEVEDGIWDTVAVLNMSGFETIASCEGHERGIDPPYVMFKHREGSGLDSLEQELQALIKEFYSSREVDERVKLIVQENQKNPPSACSVQNNVIGYYPEWVHRLPYPVTDKKFLVNNLDKLRQEFEDFAKFLYKKWLAGYRFKG